MKNFQIRSLPVIVILLFALASGARAQSPAAANTGAAQGITPTSAQLNGTFLPPAAQPTFGPTAQEYGYFEYGPTPTYSFTTPAIGPIGSCFGADYNDDQGFVTSGFSVAFNGAFTIEAWIYNNGSSQDETILVTTANAPGNNSKVRLSLNYSVPRFEVWDSGGNYYDIVSASNPVPGGQWVHLAVVLSIDSNNNLPTTIYVNGQNVASKTFSYESRSVGNRQIYIGRSTWLHNQANGDGGYPFSGFIDEVRVWNTALDQGTIQSWMNKQVPLNSGFPSSSGHPYWAYLQHYYQFNGANGTDSGWGALNASPYGNPGSFSTGAPLLFTIPPQTISGLAPGTTYHYRAHMMLLGGTTLATGADQTFTTAGPLLDPISDQKVAKDSGNHSIPLTGINDVNPSHSAISFAATSSNPTLIPNPTIAYTNPSTTGTLTFTPAFNTTGSSVITVAETDQFSGQPVTTSHTFTITVGNLPPVVGIGTSIALSGTNGHVAVPSGIWFTNEFTVESWVYPGTNSTWARLFDFGNGAPSDSVYGAIVGPNGGPILGVFIGNGALSSVSSSTVVPPNQWSHVAFTRDSGGTGHIYLNGNEIASGPINAPASTTRYNDYIGRSEWAADPLLKANLSEFRIWNVARTPQQLTNNWTSLAPNSAANLLLYYRFNEGSGATVFDSTTFTNSAMRGGPGDGKLAGSAVWISSSGSFFPSVGTAKASAFNIYPLTISAWINTTQTSTGGLVNKYISSSFSGYQMFLSQGHLQAWYFRDANNAVYGNLDGGFVADGQWHFVTFVVDASGGKLYVDGAQKSALGWTGTPGPTTDTNYLRVADYPADSSGHAANIFNGEIAEVGMWNTSLGPTQIQGIMNATPVGTESGLLAFWPLDGEGSSPGIFSFNNLDRTGHGYSLNTIFISTTYSQPPLRNGPVFVAPDPALQSPMTITVNENSQTSFFLPAFDIDSTLTWLGPVDTNSVYEGGTFSLNPTNGTATYIPEPNYYGPVTINYSATDGQYTNTGAFNLNVLHVHQPPVANLLALNVNGSNNEVRVTGFGNIAPTNEITIEFWQKALTKTNQNTFSINAGNPANQITVQAPNYPGAGGFGDVKWYFGSALLSYSPGVDIVGSWHHFAFVSSQSAGNGQGVMQLYLDGTLVSQNAGSGVFTPGNFDLRLGAPPFKGALSEFRVWNVARTATQILGDMDTPLAGNEPGLVAYYRISEGSGITIYDSGPAQPGGPYDGHIVGGAPYPTWVPGPPNFDVFNLASFSSNNLIVLPGFSPEVPQSGLTWTITDTSNLHGTLTSNLSGGNWIYTPTPGYNGPAGFTYSISDGVLSNSATFAANVAPQIPPVISTIPNQLILQNTSTAPVPFTIGSAQTSANNLTVSVVGDNQALLDTDQGTGYVLAVVPGSGGTNQTLVLTPKADQSGSTLITVTVSDGRNTVATNFVLQVSPRPAYTIIDLGVLPSRFASYGTAINDQGQVVGYATDGTAGQNQKLAFLYTGFDAGAQLLSLGTLGGLNSAAYGINNLGKITGTAQLGNGSSHVFFYDSIANVMTDFRALGTNSGNSSSVGLGINSNGVFVGQSSTAGTASHAFVSGADLIDLGSYFSAPGAVSIATAINDSGQIVGYGQVSGGATNAFLYSPPVGTNSPASTNIFGGFPGGNNSLAQAINQFGDVAGAGDILSQNGNFYATHAWLRTSGSATNQDLGLLPGGLSSIAYGINGFRQVVGTAVRTDGSSRAFLYTFGQLNDLNDLLPNEETNVWNLTEARGINGRAEIVGTGVINGKPHAFLALPARVMGQPIPRPLGTIAQQPAIDIINPQAPDDAPGTAFFWSNPDKRLYAIRPATARIHWQTGAGLVTNGVSTNLSITVATVDVTSKNVWPRAPQIHVSTSPVEVEPQAAAGAPPVPFNYSFSSVMYSTIVGGVAVDPNAKIFSPTNTGYTVLRYLVKNGPVVDLLNALSHFEVVRTVNWSDAAWLTDGVAATVGTPITNSSHFDYQGRNGYVLLQNSHKSVYDGVGPNRAYDLPTRQGPIIPVNKVNKNISPPDDDLVVVWYHTNAIGVDWADSPYRYAPQWPVLDVNNMDQTLVIANSGGWDTSQYPGAFVYAQNDSTLPGFNPNEEHALIANNSLYPLRDDLNALYGNLSPPFVLLKYPDPNAGNAWRFRVFQVIETNAIYQFSYIGTAGQEIQPPLPLSVLQLCSASNVAVSGPWYKAQVDGKLWARAAGPNGTDANIVVHYWYPIEPTFYTGNSGAGLGSCVPWLDRGTGTPINATYDINWPNNYGTLKIGETLTTPHDSSPGPLPDITDLLSAKIIYDDLNPSGPPTATNSARLYDPLSPRSVPVPSLLLSSIKQLNVNGTVQFPDLPYFLRLRLTYDPINQLLGFQGLFAPTTPGADPVLLDNVLSARERDTIKTKFSVTTGSSLDTLINQLYDLTRNPNRLTLNPPGISATNFDKALLIGLTLGTNVTAGVTNLAIVPQTFGGSPKALTAGLFGVPPVQAIPPGSTNYPPRFVTVVSDDPTTPGSVVQMDVIRIDNGPFPGYLAVLPGDNVFDSRLTLHHSADFGGDPGQLQFEWYYHPDDQNGASPTLPLVNSDGSIDAGNLNGWLVYIPSDVPSGFGANYITIGEGGESGLLTMSDNWFISRYQGYNIRGQTNWSDWIGQPGGGGAQFAQGWVNRVLAGLNPFEARSSDFHNSPIVTYASMLEQAGARYEGDIALNPDPNYLNSVGLIQAYNTVLHIGETLSVNGTPPVNYQPANNALLNAASRISDFYVLLGNEAGAEEADPTIGFKNSSAQFGSIASSIFAFQDQLPTLLDQELCLLRGRDDSSASVRAAPVYNRLFWNFTGGNGEVAYVQVFNIADQNSDGFINATDARIQYPQGHGDAWGHYLTAVTTYYNLLRNPDFTWVPRAETVLLGGVPQQVNFEDERKFAHAASLKAQTGAEIVNLTYRSSYVDDPNGQYQGYKDTNPSRAWGVSEWARRAGQGAFFDWLTVNAVLPAKDTNNTGIARVDRITVTEINDIPANSLAVQEQLDKADAGLNPLGLAKNVVPFDIDPSLIAAGQTHFEQIYGRAVSAMVNAAAVWDQANTFTSALRSQQDTINQFSQNVQSQDTDYKNRMIEIFGYPFAGDIGPGGTYPAGYDGPDLYHYMYVDTSQFDQGVSAPSSVLAGYFAPLSFGSQFFDADSHTLVPSVAGVTNVLAINYPLADATHQFQPPVSWGQRRAPGEIQNALSELLQSQGRLQQAIDNYDNLISQIEDSANLLQAHFDLNDAIDAIQHQTDITTIGLKAGITAAKLVAMGAKAYADSIESVTQIALESVPREEGLAVDGLAGLRGGMKSIDESSKVPAKITEAAANLAIEGMTATMSNIQSQASESISATNAGYALNQQLKALSELVRQATPAQVQVYTLREAVVQSVGRYQSALAEGQRVGEQRAAFAKQTAAQTQQNRYQDMTFRIFQNDAIQKYRAQLDLAQRYVFLAAIAYDFETQLLGGSSGSGQQFLTDIIRQQSLGEMNNGAPVNGVQGLADPLARLSQNFAVLKGQLGFNNPQTETGKFSLRYGLFRQQPGVTNALPLNGVFTNDWPTELKNHIVPDLWQIPEFRRYCRPFAPESAGPQPGIVIRFSSTITFGLNFFGWPLSGGDSSYDPTLFATKVRSVGTWFAGYDNSGLSTTPRIYLIPVGADVMRSPSGDTLAAREWQVVDQQLPVPFPLGASTLANPAYIPVNDSLSGTLENIRRFSSFLAYTDQGNLVDPTQVTTDTRLIGRSVWNTDWMLIIPGGTLLFDPNQGLDAFVNSVSDIKIFFQTYSYSGN